MNKCRMAAMVLFLFVVAVNLAAQDIGLALNQFVANIGDEASHSICIVNANTQKELVASDARKRMTPASLMKLSTTAVALELFGNDYQFKTNCFISGNIKDGVLSGDLIVEGGGDPTLGSSKLTSDDSNSFFKQIADALSQKGIKTIKGNILLIDDYFGTPSLPQKRIWEDLGNYYGAIPHGLTYRDNSFNLFLQSPKAAGGKCSIVEVDKCMANVVFKCNVTSANNNVDNANVLGVDGMTVWNVNGTMPKGQSRFLIKGAMPNPAMVLGDDLKLYLNSRAIDVMGVAKVIVNETLAGDMKKIVEFKSLPLIAIIKEINHNSNNLYADHLFLLIGKHLKQNGSWSSASEAVNDFWKVKGIEFVCVDGSGMSPFNGMSSAEMVQILTYFNGRPQAAAFKASMPVGGESGTIKALWKDYPGKVMAKSGSMMGVLCYAGYIKTLRGNDYAFAIMVNHSAKQVSALKVEVERFVNTIVAKY